MRALVDGSLARITPEASRFRRSVDGRCRTVILFEASAEKSVHMESAENDNDAIAEFQERRRQFQPHWNRNWKLERFDLTSFERTAPASRVCRSCR